MYELQTMAMVSCVKLTGEFDPHKYCSDIRILGKNKFWKYFAVEIFVECETGRTPLVYT